MSTTGVRQMFTIENTEGFAQSDLNLMNKALETYMAQHANLDDDDRDQLERHASDLINNNWQETGNTVESLLRGLAR